MKRFFSAVLGVALASSISTSEANAEAISLTGQSEVEWRQDLMIYAFLPVRTKGTSTIAGTSVPLNLDLSDALNLLDFAAAGHYEAWKGNLGFIVDANYMSLKANAGIPSAPGATVDADVRQKWLGLLAAYKVADGKYGKDNRRYAVDLQAGVRYNSLRQEIKITTAGGTTLPTLGGDEGWWEPVIGARGTWVLNDKWAAIASVDLGGFGAGGNDLQIGANAGLNWHAWDNTSVVFGYRYFSMDYSTVLATGPFAYDVDQHGPFVGVKFRF